MSETNGDDRGRPRGTTSAGTPLAHPLRLPSDASSLSKGARASFSLDYTPPHDDVFEDGRPRTPSLSLTPATPPEQDSPPSSSVQAPPLPPRRPTIGSGGRPSPMPRGDDLVSRPKRPPSPLQREIAPMEEKVSAPEPPHSAQEPHPILVVDYLSYFDLAVATLLLVNILITRLSVFVLLSIGVVWLVHKWWSVRKKATAFRNRLLDSQKEANLTAGNGSDADAVGWVNHAIAALFPLISTDILTPFLDLMEDALMEQTPAIVTSVRLTSMSLGKDPVVLTSLRPMTDEEWFATVGDTAKPRDVDKARKTHHKADSAVDIPLPPVSPFVPPSASKRTHRSSSSTTAVPNGGNGGSQSKRDPSVAGSSLKRDHSISSLLDKVKGRSRSNSQASSINGEAPVRKEQNGLSDDPARRHLLDATERQSSLTSLSMSKTSSNNSTSSTSGSRNHDPKHEGRTKRADGLEEGEYVNYSIGFDYARRGGPEKLGWGIHVLAYFGWGIKHIAKSELPIYIDLLSLRGTLNVRLLLSATPPFVRTATISLPGLPDIEPSAVPLRKGSINAMELPGIKNYVLASISEVASEFISPKSYSLDIDRLILGRESSLRTQSVGVLQIVIHRANELLRSDTIGGCDPYVVISMSKFHKPLYSTRTVLSSRHPVWEETAFILIPSDALKSYERIRLRVVDADRFSSDDDVGVVEVDLRTLVENERVRSPDSPLHRYNSPLKADRAGMEASGNLEWSVRFCPVWEMPVHEFEMRWAETRKSKKGEPGPDDGTKPEWLAWLMKSLSRPEWEVERAERRDETMAWLCGQKEREEMEALARPTDDLPSGILQFHVHQCRDLEIEMSPTALSSTPHRKHKIASAVSKPALSTSIDRTATENPEPPSSYVEVLLNDHLVFRTRTKQLTPIPYYNAVAERFVRDWRLGQITFVVRDERNMENDPILGLVHIRLKDAFEDHSQITQWFPLVGGLGWGRIHLSLLFKPVDMRLPRGISGYEVATLYVTGLTVTESQGVPTKGVSVTMETEVDRYQLSTPDNVDMEVEDRADFKLREVDRSKRNSPKKRPLSMTSSRASSRATTPDPSHSGENSGTVKARNRPNSIASTTLVDMIRSTSRSGRSPFDSRNNISGGNLAELEWDIDRPIRLAVQYRHSSLVALTFFTRSAVRRRHKIFGIATVKLDDIPDDLESEKTVPIFGTDDMRQALKAIHAYEDATNEESSDSNTTSSVRFDEASALPKMIGMVKLGCFVKPGIGKVHRRLCRKDLRFKRVYEAWEMSKEVERGVEGPTMKERWRDGKREMARSKDRHLPAYLQEYSEDEDEDDDEAQANSDSDSDNEEDRSAGKRSGSGRMTPAKLNELDDDTEKGFFAKQVAHSRALHKRNQGIFQLKVARTGKFFLDKLEAKVLARKDDRRRGADLHVEHEGVSRL